jgi:hypothetical protein
VRLLKRALAVLGAFVVVAAIAAVVVPDAARGIAAALVQVTNTSANPVPNLDVNTPAEQPFETILCTSVGVFAGECPSSEPSEFVVPSTTTDGATVKRLVIENVSGSCAIGATTQVLGMGIDTTIGENTVNGLSTVQTLVPVLGSSPGKGAVYGQAARLYADPGAIVGMEPFVGGSTDLICGANVNGYLVTK